MSGVADILRDMAEAAGRRPSGMSVVGNAIEDASHIPGQIYGMQQQRAALAQQQRRQAMQDQIAQDANARANSDQTTQDAEAQRVTQRRAVVNGALNAAMGASGDITQFDGKAAFVFLARAGQVDAMPDVIKAHQAMQETVTQLNPELDTYRGGKLETRGVKKPPEVGTPQREIYDRAQVLQRSTPVAPGDVGPPTPGLSPEEASTRAYADQRKAVEDNKRSPIEIEWQDHVRHGGTQSFDEFRKSDANLRTPKISVSGMNAPPPPGDFAKEGKDFLATIPVQWRRTVDKIANYDEDPTKVASMRGDMRSVLMQWVNQVNPGYDASMFSNRAPTRRAYTTGTQGQTVNALNTAMGHLDQLTGLIDKLDNSAFVPGNKVWNDLRTMFGSDAITNFETLKDALAGEVSKTLSGQATVSGIAEQRALMNNYASPKSLAGYIKTLIPVMGSKLYNLDYQYHQAMGERDSWSALSPESKRILVSMGFDPAHPTVQGGGGGAGPTTTIYDMNGKKVVK